LTTPLHYLAAHRDDAVARLRELLSIPSVSTDPAYAQHVRHAADWVADALRDAGLSDVHVIKTQGHPVVLAHSRDSEVDLSRASKRVLFYGHYDVQPPDPLEGWTTPPFEPTIRDGAIHARGASDDKGQVLCFIEAIRAWRHGSPDRKLPCHLTVLIEGEEECGSVHLRPFLEQYRDQLNADVVLISDTTMWNRQTVGITYGLRGLLYYDVQLHGPSRDLHSGVYGGTLANPCVELTAVLGRLFDAGKRCTIPGFYDDVVPVDSLEQQRWSALGFDEAAHLGAVGATPVGEAGFTTMERNWARPSCDINGLYGGYGGKGAKTVIPAFAGAKVSFRLAARQDPAKIAAAFEAWLHAQNVHGCRWQLTHLGGCPAVLLPAESPYIAAAGRAIVQSTGRPPALVREGATIPVVADFQRLLGIGSLLVGFGLNDDRIHSPNEKFDLACFELGCRTHALMLAELGAVK
jgi:acetylornithine deacetylase/succinyl-diaminopimelate desuccinylase-like protein